MKICIPTQKDNGIDSQVYGHFGSAGFFIIHDTESGETKSIPNPSQEHGHGQCHPIGALQGESVNAVVVGGIGRRAIEGFNAAGIQVYQASEGTVRENVEKLINKALAEFTPEGGCSHHGHGDGCGH